MSSHVISFDFKSSHLANIKRDPRVLVPKTFLPKKQQKEHNFGKDLRPLDLPAFHYIDDIVCLTNICFFFTGFRLWPVHPILPRLRRLLLRLQQSLSPIQQPGLPPTVRR